MRKTIKVLAVLAAMAVCFLLGWRVMPRVWPAIKENVVYAVLPDMRPAPTATPVPYQPSSNATLTDTVAPTDSLVYYFYKPYCPYCQALDSLMHGLPKQITLPDGTVSQVKVVAVDKQSEEGAALIAAYYERSGIPEERQYVPAVVIGDQYYMPASEICDGLMPDLLSGAGLNTLLLDGTAR